MQVIETQCYRSWCLTITSISTMTGHSLGASDGGYFSLSHKRRAFGRAGPVLGILGCAAEILHPQRDQPLLLLVDMCEWLSEDDLVFVVLDAVATLDLGGSAAAFGLTGAAGRRLTRR